ncbi:GNAT family N-acetyltransferase [Sanguibacter massiliensis]|uniref:GNAT family N-acetyltransferase n=1 Tax=Sanguibacter massiliensis TaxID=1973217 RepID=UPI000C85C15F|nr:GNAT family N-acetyltransferase [Sanguibacter massiliensis]
MVGPTLVLVRHEELSGVHLDGLRRMFDGEYARDFGDWDPEQPYGYAPHDIYVIARDHRGIVGHVGWARRTIVVGARHVVIAGVGGVIVAGRARGSRLGSILMDVTAGSIADAYQQFLVTRRTWLESENRRLGPNRGEGDLGEQQL